MAFWVKLRKRSTFTEFIFAPTAYFWATKTQKGNIQHICISKIHLAKAFLFSCETVTLKFLQAELGVVVHLGKLRQEDGKFKDFLGYRVSSRPGWAFEGDPATKAPFRKD